MPALQPVEDDHLVEPVQELRPEMAADDVHHPVHQRPVHRGFACLRKHFAAEIGGHDKDRVAEIHRPAVPVGQASVVEHLEQHVEDIGMRLLHLVEQHDLVGAPAHRLGQRAAFLIADIAGRRAEQAGDRVLLHVFRHVEPQHRRVVVEQELRERLAKLGLADAGRPEEQEGAHRAARVVQAGPRAAHRLRDRLDGAVLADDAGVEALFHSEQLLALALQHSRDGHARPARDDARDMLAGDLLVEQAPFASSVGLGDAPLQVGNDGETQLARALQFSAPLGCLQLQPGPLQFLLHALGAVDGILFLPPLQGERAGALLEAGQFLLQFVEASARGVVGFLLQRLPLDLELDDPPVEFVDGLGLGVDLHPEPARRLVHQVDGLVGQEPVRDVAVGQCRCRHQRAVGDAHAVMDLVFLLQPAQDRNRVLYVGLADEHRLEAPRERGVLLDMLTVFVERGRADAVQLAARERGLEHVRGVHRAVGLAGADQRVQLVDEDHDLALGRLDFRQHGLQPLLELAAVFRSGDHGAEVERDQLLVPQAFGRVAIDDPLGETLGDGGLADARLADQHGVVLGAPGEDLDRAPDFLVAPDHRVELAVARRLGQVLGVSGERIEPGFGIGAVGRASLAKLRDDALKPPGVHARFAERAASHRHRLQQALHGDEAVAGLLRRLARRLEQARGLGRQMQPACARAADDRQRRKRPFDRSPSLCRVAACPLDQAGGHALGVVEHDLEYVFGNEALMPCGERRALRCLDESARTLGVSLEIHMSVSVFRREPLSGGPQPARRSRSKTDMGTGGGACKKMRRAPRATGGQTASAVASSAGAPSAGCAASPVSAAVSSTGALRWRRRRRGRGFADSPPSASEGRSAASRSGRASASESCAPSALR